MSVLAILGALVQPVTKIITNRQENNAAKEVVKGKLAETKEQGAQLLELNDQQQEVVATALKGSSWVDEYATLLVTSPFMLVFAGAIAAAFGHPELLEGTKVGITTLKETGIDVGFLTEAVVLAAVGLSIWRKA